MITYLYTGYLKVEADQVPILNNLCHRLQCASLSQYLKFQRQNELCSQNNDGSVNFDYARDLELLEGIQLKAQLVFEKKNLLIGFSAKIILELMAPAFTKKH